ncbi:MAG: hypothetical protein HFF90_03425 [Oscillibacter sp.]|nr:hypothetical protein [Oscillibacter sp.]
MSGGIQVGRGVRMYGVPAGTREAKKAESRACGFLEMARSAQSVDAYVEHLREKYGRVTIESVGKDEISLQKAGGRMSGHDVVIAPNILENMARDPKTALSYERKIDYFFNTVIPQGNAICAARGLVFEPCGVVVHEDGTVTYICGCSDSPERVAEVNRINAEKARKRAEQYRQYQEQSMAAAELRRELLTRTAAAGTNLCLLDL